MENTDKGTIHELVDAHRYAFHPQNAWPTFVKHGSAHEGGTDQRFGSGASFRKRHQATFRGTETYASAVCRVFSKHKLISLTIVAIDSKLCGARTLKPKR